MAQPGKGRLCCVTLPMHLPNLDDFDRLSQLQLHFDGLSDRTHVDFGESANAVL
jgi:hypothetical protein